MVAVETWQPLERARSQRSQLGHGASPARSAHPSTGAGPSPCPSLVRLRCVGPRRSGLGSALPGRLPSALGASTLGELTAGRLRRLRGARPSGTWPGPRRGLGRRGAARPAGRRLVRSRLRSRGRRLAGAPRRGAGADGRSRPLGRCALGRPAGALGADCRPRRLTFASARLASRPGPAGAARPGGWGALGPRLTALVSTPARERRSRDRRRRVRVGVGGLVGSAARQRRCARGAVGRHRASDVCGVAVGSGAVRPARRSARSGGSGRRLDRRPGRGAAPARRRRLGPAVGSPAGPSARAGRPVAWSALPPGARRRAPRGAGEASAAPGRRRPAWGGRSRRRPPRSGRRSTARRLVPALDRRGSPAPDARPRLAPGAAAADGCVAGTCTPRVGRAPSIVIDARAGPAVAGAPRRGGQPERPTRPLRARSGQVQPPSRRRAASPRPARSASGTALETPVCSRTCAPRAAYPAQRALLARAPQLDRRPGPPLLQPSASRRPRAQPRDQDRAPGRRAGDRSLRPRGGPTHG